MYFRRTTFFELAVYKSQVNLQQLICKTTSYSLNNLKYHRLVNIIFQWKIGFSPLVDEGDKKNEQKTLRHEQAHVITNDLDLINTFQQQQQQQQYSTCNQLTERVYTKVRTVKPSVQTREHIDHPNSVLTESPIAPKDNKGECDKDECDAKAVETSYNGILHTTSNESINKVIETSIITQKKPNYAEVVVLSSALVNSAKTSEQSEISQNQSSKIVEKSNVLGLFMGWLYWSIRRS